VLDVDEHRRAVGCLRGAGDLAVRRAGEKAADLAGGAVAGQHLVVADARKLALVHLRGVHVGLDPQHAARIDIQAIGAGEDVALDVALRLGPGVGRVAGQHEVVPVHRGAAEVGVFLPADDLAHHVVGARVGGVDTRLAGGAALAVVGQRAVDLARVLVDGDPLRPVHLRGAEQVARLARLDEHLALVGKAVGAGQRA